MQYVLVVILTYL